MDFKNEFNELAKLSCLSFSEEDEKLLISDMKSMISFACRLSRFESLEESSDFFITCERKDIPKESFDAKEILKNAPTSEDGYFKLPQKSQK